MCFKGSKVTTLITVGAEIWTSLDLEWSKRGWVANGLDYKWNLKFGNPTI